LAAPPLVSIGLPVHNGERFLEQAARSLLAQEAADLELLIADNGSTDRTPEIAAGLAAADPRVAVHRSPENRGAAWNYNRLVDLARGRYFKWAAHDDLYAPAFVRRCLEVLEADPGVVLAYTTARDVDAEGGLVAELAPRPYAGEPSAPERVASLLAFESSCFECFGLMRRGDLLRTRRIGAFTSSDRVFLLELALLGRFREIPEPLFLHRQHAERGVARYPDPRARNVWFDPARAGKLTFPRWRLLAEYARSLLRAPLPPAQRARCLAHLARWAARQGVPLARELGGGARQATERLAGGPASRA
jgi:glycosyltransferase involved in cell wall biosynthesis